MLETKIAQAKAYVQLPMSFAHILLIPAVEIGLLRPMALMAYLADSQNAADVLV